jgi:hypothetical protein
MIQIVARVMKHFKTKSAHVFTDENNLFGLPAYTSGAVFTECKLSKS